MHSDLFRRPDFTPPGVSDLALKKVLSVAFVSGERNEEIHVSIWSLRPIHVIDFGSVVLLVNILFNGIGAAILNENRRVVVDVREASRFRRSRSLFLRWRSRRGRT